MVMIASARAQASAAESAASQPTALAAARAPWSRSKTVTERPARRSACAIPEPILPRPMKAVAPAKGGGWSVMRKSRIGAPYPAFSNSAASAI